jgi:hypothetical protein
VDYFCIIRQAEYNKENPLKNPMEKTNLYSISIPPMVKAFKALSAILDKAVAHSETKASERQPGSKHMEALLNERLVFDQFPLVRQVQIASDQAKGTMGRLAEIEVPKFEDNEKTVEELKARIEKTISFLESIKPEQIIGKEEMKLPFAYDPTKYLTGLESVTEYLLPNFFFHVTTAYAILRKNGVNIGKSDFTGGLPLKDL